MSGVDLDGVSIRKGAPDAMLAYIQGGQADPAGSADELWTDIARTGGTPLVVARNGEPLGVIHLKDIVKGGIKERFAQLRQMGIKTVMITGDNPSPRPPSPPKPAWTTSWPRRRLRPSSS